MDTFIELFEKLIYYFSFPFVQYAVAAGILISLCSSLLGVTLVLKRYSFIGDGLSHTAFGALSIAAVLNFTNNMYFVLPLTILCAILLLRTGKNTKIKGDAAIAMISVGSLALGYLIMNVFAVSSNISGDVCTTLFGSTSILTLKKEEVRLCLILSTAVIGTFIILYNKIFAVTFDENFAKASGLKTNIYNLIIAVITAVIIVLAMNLVGSLLISALVVFPALSAMRVYKSFKSVTICSAVISAAGAMLGIFIAILAGTPVGSTIVAVDIAEFIIFSIIGKITNGGKSKASLLAAAVFILPLLPSFSIQKSFFKKITVSQNDFRLTGNGDKINQNKKNDNFFFVKSQKTKFDVDLTRLSATMVFAQVFNMLVSPELFDGKTIKMRGQFMVYPIDKNETIFAVVISDATACCQQGLEFKWQGHVYPDEYPKQGEQIEVVGKFTIAKNEEGIDYFYIESSSVKKCY